MALQTQNLTMVGLGVLEDTQPSPVQPTLVDGIHLRWAFKPELGFPKHGFYLFRRLHRKATPLCLSDFIGNLPQGEWPNHTLNIPGQGQIRSDLNLLLTDDFDPGGPLEFDLGGHSNLRFIFIQGEPTHSIEVRIGFREKSEIKVIAHLGETPVAQSVVSGRAGDILTATLKFDAITEVRFSSGPAVLIDLCYFPVLRDATAGWEPIPNFQYPMCLPVTHPDYPCTQGMSEDLPDARELAKNRIRYGDPNEFTSPPISIHTAGTITTVNGSPIITGMATNWSEALVGEVLQVSGDSTAYMITGIVESDRLILSRDYSGASKISAEYAINEDNFGQLHDYLVHLVRGDITALPMANRFLPIPVYGEGKAIVVQGHETVNGIGTSWTENLAGLAIQFSEISVGTLGVIEGSSSVIGIGTIWSNSLVGLALRIAGESRGYTITNVTSSTQLTLDRVYVGSTEGDKDYTIFDRAPYTIINVDSPTRLTLNKGYRREAEFGVEKTYDIISVLGPTEAGGIAPRVSTQYPLNLVLLGSLHPAIAQMVGLHWVDETAEPGKAFDYLILADYEAGIENQDPGAIIRLIKQNGFSDLEGYIVFDRKVAPLAPLSSPINLRSYALPGGTKTIEDDNLQDASNNAGMRWDLEVTVQEQLLPLNPIMYHLWRAKYGSEEPATPAPANQYELTTKDRPILITRPHLPLGVEPQRPLNWPPFRMHAFDNGLPDGWYSYKVSGIDIFGRHTRISEPAQWDLWEPVPDPQPWYYQDPPGDLTIHSFAVGLFEKIPPPPPTGIEAYALDPADTTILKDEAYNAWRATLSLEEQDNVIGLRVRWLWTHAHMRQAPDTREFRIYFHPDQLNVRLGRALTVIDISDTESGVETDIPNTQPANTYSGAWVRIGADAFRIVSSEASDPLHLRVKNIGPSDDIRPRADMPCTLAIPSNYNAGRVSVQKDSPTFTGTGTEWHTELSGRILKIAGESKEYQIISVDSQTQQLTLDQGYPGISGTDKVYVITHPLHIDHSIATHWQTRYFVVNFDDVDHVDETFDEDNRPFRKYEVFLPVPGGALRDSLPLTPTVEEPIAYAYIGVSAADDKTHTLDDPKWGLGNFGGRFGNEGRIGAPAKIFRVLRELPEPPSLPPPDSDKVFATPADYHSHSYYTYRWKSIQHLKAHIFRALDDAVFKVDWSQRPREALAPNDSDAFPSETDEPNWNPAKRQQVADEVNQLNIFSHDGEGSYQAMAVYRRLSNDALRVLAGLAGNERAFTQLTIQPLDPDDPANTDHPGPDNPADFPFNPELRLYIDTLDGRATNRYFYRAAYVDGAHNRSKLSLSGPPVYLPNVVPPRAPVITKVLGGDRQITLRWASNREPDLVEYRVYRADNKETARDLRLMTLVHTEAVPPGDPATRPAKVEWIDDPVPGIMTLYYVLVAVDVAGNVSLPSPALPGRAFDDSGVAPPTWNSASIDPANGVLTLNWLANDNNLSCLIQRRLDDNSTWENLSGWLPRGLYTFEDSQREEDEQYHYRLRVLNNEGKMNKEYIGINL